MICISVTPESRQLAKVDILNAGRQSDLVEVCVDHLIKEPDFKDLLVGAKKPVMISCRTTEEGGRFTGTADERIMLLKQGILAGPAYIEMDVETAKRIPRFGKVQRVISFTSLNRPLLDVDAHFDEAVKVQADVIKFVWPTQTLETAWPMLAAVSQKRNLPIVGMGIGRCGLTFSLLARKYGSPWIYAALEKGMEAYPGEPTVGDLDDIYRWRQIDHKTRFVGLAGLGDMCLELARVLNAAFDRQQLNLRCLPFDFKSVEQLPKMLEILKVGAILVMPEAGPRIFSLAEHADEVAQTAKHCDLLLKQPDGWHAYALLWKVALRSLEAALGRKSAEDRPLDRRNVLIVGSGGVARSLAAGIKRRSGLVSLVAGDDVEAQHAAAALEARFVPAAKIYDTLTDVLLMTANHLDHGKRTAPINPSLLKPGLSFLDLSQFPAGSSFVDEARDRSCRLVETAEVFQEYVAAVFKSITGQEFPAE